MRKFLALALLSLAVVACNATTSSVANDQRATDTQLQQYQAVQPAPFFNWSQTRQVLIDIYRAQNDARQTWAVVTSMTGVAIFACESVGYPIPADTQLTNPDQIAIYNPSGTSFSGVVGQMEPNGTYSSTATNGTYVLCIRPDGKLAPIYTESYVSLFPFEVKVVDGRIVDAGGAATINVDVTAPANIPTMASPGPAK